MAHHIARRKRQFYLLVIALVLQLPAFAVEFDVTKASCHGKEDGAIDLIPPTGNGPYTFEWSNGATTEDIFDLAEGTYTVKITDKDGCELEESVEVEVEEDKPKLQIKGGGNRTFCQDDTDKKVTLTAVASDCEECEYSWSTGSTSASIEVSSSGTYTCTATSKDGCFIDESAEVTIETKDCDDDDDDDSDDIDIPIIRSSDPNDIIGPVGVGPQKWVSQKDILPYKIRYENDPDFATAPAQKVIIKHPVSENLNIFSFRLGSFGFGDFVFEVPEQTTFYTTQVDVVDSLGVVVNLVAGIDVTKREVFWIFESLDPETGLAPDDATLGYLLVNDTITRRGEGFVSFTIQPDRSTLTEDSIYAIADIVFDINESILTPEIFNTIDAAPPTSNVDSIPAIVDSVYAITVSGVDDYGLNGSGISDYDLYISEDDGNTFTAVARNVPIGVPYNFTGEPGKDYCAYSIARDSVGNEEFKGFAEVCFSVRNRAYITVLTPNGGDEICAGTEIPIVWESDNVDSLNISYSDDSGLSYQTLITGIPTTDSVYNWTVPIDFPGGEYLLRLTSTNDSTIFDESDTVFTVLGVIPVEIFVAATSLCEGDSAFLDAGGGYDQYVWSTGDSTQTIIVGETGTYTVYATDANGCVSTDEIEIIIHPIPEQPEIIASGPLTFCPSDSVILSGPAGFETYDWSTGDTTESIVVHITSDILLTVTDSNSCQNTSELVSILVTDTIPPTLTLPADILQTADQDTCGAQVVVPLPEVNDDCEIFAITNDFNNSDNATGFYPIGNTWVTWTLEDGVGNITIDSMEVIVTDDQAPTISAVVEITQSTDPGSCSALVSVDIPATNDNCEIISIVNSFNDSTDASGLYPIGETTVIWEVEDASGNLAFDTTLINIVDDELPTINAPADLTVSTDSAVCEAFVTIGLPTVSDNCGSTTTTNSYNNTTDASDIYPIGETTVVWFATDSAGNIASDTMLVTVLDNENPFISAPADVTVSADPGTCNAYVDLGNAATSDNCSVASVVNDYNGSQSASDTYPVGETVVIWTVVDESGNSATDSTIVSVVDDQLPAITAPADITVDSEPAQCGANIAIPIPQYSENCSLDTIYNDQNGVIDASGFYTVGTTLVTWTVIDLAGNASYDSMAITVNDVEAPALTLPADIVQSTDSAQCGAYVNISTPGYTDNCGNVTLINSFNNSNDASGFYPLGSTSVVWTATDDAGNVTLDSMSVTVEDTESPSIQAPADITVSSEIGQCSANVQVGSPVVNDNCGVFSVVNNYNNSPDASGIYAVGTTTVRWTVTDNTGNSASMEMDITVVDDEPPVMSGLADITQSTDPGACEAYVNVPIPNNSDNCGFVSLINNINGTNNATGIYPVGATILQWTATDSSGNVTVDSIMITVIDDEMPDLTVPADLVVDNDVDTCGAFVTIDMPVYGDNCEISTITNSVTGGIDASGFYSLGSTVISWSVTDESGNVSTDSMSVTVNDTQSPTIEVPADITTTADSGTCGAEVSIGIPIVSDNCEVSSLVNDYTNSENASGFYPVGSTTVTWTVTDPYGNQTSASMVVTIEDNEAPSLIAPSDITQSTDAGICGATVSIPVPVTSDNCGAVSLVNDFNNLEDASGLYPVGTTTVTWIATDANGNSSLDSMLVTITDQEAPTMTVSADISQSSDPGACGAEVSIPVPETMDNCGVISLINSFNGSSDASGFYPVGTTTVSWTATDNAGNFTSDSLVVSISDTEAPIIIAPADITLNVDSCQAFAALSLPVVSDNCEVAVLVNDYNSSDDASDWYPVGTTIVTWTVTDAAGNTSSASTNVEVIDNVAPIISDCPTDISLTANSLGCSAVANWDEPTAFDACGVASVTSNYTPADSFALGTTTVTYLFTDVNGNVSTCSFNVTVEAEQLAVSLDTKVYACGYNVSCHGESDGEVTANVTGGCAPYSYAWSDGQVGNVVNFGAGTYSVTVTDGNGATNVATVTLTEPAVLSGTTTVSEYDGGYNVSCAGASDGIAEIMVSGGCEPYMYLWSDGQTGPEATGLSGGMYTVNVYDANGCHFTDTVYLTEPSTLTVVAGENKKVYYGYAPEECTTLEVESISGGVPGYTYLWSTGETTPTIEVCPIADTEYTVTVYDQNGCEATDVVKVCVEDVTCKRWRKRRSGIKVCRRSYFFPWLRFTLCLPEWAVDWHLRHGATLGSCSSDDVCYDDGDIPMARVDDEEVIIEGDLFLEAYPNPFDKATIISMYLPGVRSATLKIYDLNGREVAELFNGELDEMEHYEFEFVPRSDTPKGIYFYRLSTDDGRVITKKMIFR